MEHDSKAAVTNCHRPGSASRPLPAGLCIGSHPSNGLALLAPWIKVPALSDQPRIPLNDRKWIWALWLSFRRFDNDCLVLVFFSPFLLDLDPENSEKSRRHKDFPVQHKQPNGERPLPLRIRLIHHSSNPATTSKRRNQGRP